MADNEAKSWEAYNDLLLYGGFDRLNRILARSELSKMVVDLPPSHPIKSG